MHERSNRMASLLLTLAFVLVACGGGPAPTTQSATQSATITPTSIVTSAPPSGAPVTGATGPSLQTIIGATPPPIPTGTTWSRIGADNGAYTFEVPSTWTQHQTLPWAEADGTTSGSIVVAGPAVGGLGTDFTKPGVAIGITTNPGARTPRQVVDADDYSTFCTGAPAADENGAGYAASYRMWNPCGGSEDAFILVIVVAPAGTQALFAVIFQGASQADLGYIEHIIGSLQTGGGTPTATFAAATTPPGNSQGWTANVEECLSQINDAIAIGTITNVDTRSHSYRVYVRFTDPSNLLVGEDYWDTPALDPGQSYRYEVRHMALNGVTNFRCTLSEVLIRN